jgi:hypothetical protein
VVAEGTCEASPLALMASSASFESAHVHAVYNEIALDFSRTRHSRWPFLEKFLNQLPAVRLLFLSLFYSTRDDADPPTTLREALSSTLELGMGNTSDVEAC